MADHDIAARLDAVLGVLRPMLVHPSDHELVEALLRRIETVEPRAVRLTEAVLDEAKHKIQQDAAADLFRVLARPERAIPGNPRAIAGQSRWVDDGSSLTHRTDLGGWIPVGDRLPTEDDLDDYGDVLVAAKSDAGDVQPWTDRAYLSDGVWHWSRGNQQPPPGIRITHWMPVPLPPGASDEPPASQPRSPWIAVGDALPDDPDEEVVALAGGLGGGFPALAHYSPSGGWHDCYGRDLSLVTHWARWPESPDSPNA